MQLTHYSPTSLKLPTDCQLLREFHDRRTHLPGKPLLTEQDYAHYETHTVFNDVFLHASDGYLGAIGPPLVNLRSALLPLKLRVEGVAKPLKHRLIKQDRVTFHRFTLPRSLHETKSLRFSCEFKNSLELKGTATRQCLPRVKLQFVTLQKNNPVHWIIDWLRYSRSLGVERVLLYDNGSDNRDSLATALKASNDLPQVILIDWPFPYGPGHSRYNQFCQASQNNHAHQCFAAADWVGHFDVDEYLVTEQDQSLSDLLNQASARTALLRFDSYWVPNLDPDLRLTADERAATVRDFPYRERQPRGKAHKYIVRQAKLRMANTHNARVRLGYRRMAVPIEQGAFLHYKSLTNRWKGPRGQAETMNARQHLSDDRVIRRMQLLGK